MGWAAVLSLLTTGGEGGKGKGRREAWGEARGGGDLEGEPGERVRAG